MSHRTNIQNLNFSPLSDDLISRIHYWVPPVSELVPQNKKPVTNLRIGAVIDERVFQGFRYEAELILLTPSNYEAEISLDKLDFVLIESCRESVTGHWTHAQVAENQNNAELVQLVDLAKEYGLPVVYWFTCDHTYHDQYSNFFCNVSHIFCADPLETARLKAQNISATTLLPAVQPVVHHPFKEYNENDSFEINVLYDGWADLLRLEEAIPVGALNSFDIKIIDSRNSIFESKLSDAPAHREKILGCVDRFSRLTTLRYTKVEVSFGASLASPTTQSWMALEALACRVPRVHLGELRENDVRKEFVVECVNLKDFQMQLAKIIEEPSYRESLAQMSWREINLKHTFEKRLNQICSEIGVVKKNLELPLVTVIGGSNRPSMIWQLIKSYRKQRYARKELIIVFNGDADDTEKVKREILNENDASIRFVYQPMELYSGACLNSGAHAAKGKYSFRMDDDDYYSSHYLSDAVLYLNAVDADIFGKPPCSLYFEDEGDLYVRQTDTPPLTKLTNHMLRNMRLRLGGNALAGKTVVLRKQGFHDNSFATEDSAFLIEAAQHDLNIYSLDAGNVVASRRSNGSHTWKCSDEVLKSRSSLLAGWTVPEYLGDDIPLSNSSMNMPKSRPVVLILGPTAYGQGIWQNRVEYIFPDLFESLSNHAEIHMLTGPIPDFAKEGIQQLAKMYGVVVHGLPRRGGNEKYAWWISQGLKYAKEIQATVISNVFGGVLHGYAAVKIAHLVSARSVVRVAGDEIESALAVGHYERDSWQHHSEVRKAHITFNSADSILVMSMRERGRIAHFCEDVGKIYVCNRGVDLNKFAVVNSNVKQKVFTFLYVGRKSQEKGYDLIEAAAKQVCKTHPDLRFLFAGDFDKAKIDNRKYLSFVATEELPALYDKADALILSSRTEGMPQAVMEAMAKGLPCIVSRHLFENQFEDRENVLLTEIDADNLIQQIVLLSRNSDLAEKLGKNARRYAEEHFDSTNASIKYSNLVLGIS